jgi:uncharacterized protein YqcC (DUF446 family)
MDDDNNERQTRNPALVAFNSLLSVAMLVLFILGWVFWVRIPRHYKPKEGNLGRRSALAFAIAGIFCPFVSIGSIVISRQSSKVMSQNP